MDNISVSGTQDGNGKITVDLTKFTDIKYDKTGTHNAKLTIKDKYGREVVKDLTFNYN